MLVTSPVFLLFSAAVILADRFLPVKFRAALLLVASLFAYGWWQLWAPLFLAAYALVNYLLAFLNRKAPKTFAVSLLFNASLFVLLGRAGFLSGLFDGVPALESILFPLGFSYYMFRCVGYQADIALKRLEPERNPVNLALFLCFYPILTMGPITRAGDFLPQIQNPERPGRQDFRECLFLIGFSLFKKFVFADNMARLLAPWFAADGALHRNGLVWFFLLLCYIVQLYLDFSAYTDIALATSRLLGFSVNPNFRAPFLSQSISDFWRRWHMGLSSWFADYLFAPLQIKLRRLGLAASVIAAFVTLTVSGMWHRFSWNYLCWGLATAFFISLDAVFAKRRKKIAKAMPKRLFAIITTGVTFILSVLIITFIRAEGISQARFILSATLNPATYLPSLSLFGKMTELLWTLLAALPFVALSHAIELAPGKRLPSLLAAAGRVPYLVRVILLVILIYAFIFFGQFGSDLVGGFQYAQF